MCQNPLLKAQDVMDGLAERLNNPAPLNAFEQKRFHGEAASLRAIDPAAEHCALAMLALLNQDESACVRHGVTMVVLDPSAINYSNLYLLLLDLGQIRAAFILLKEAVAIYPDHLRFWIDLTELSAVIGDKSWLIKAMQSLQRMNRLNYLDFDLILRKQAQDLSDMQVARLLSQVPELKNIDDDALFHHDEAPGLFGRMLALAGLEGEAHPQVSWNRLFFRPFGVRLRFLYMQAALLKEMDPLHYGLKPSYRLFVEVMRNIRQALQNPLAEKFEPAPLAGAEWEEAGVDGARQIWRRADCSGESAHRFFFRVIPKRGLVSFIWLDAPKGLQTLPKGSVTADPYQFLTTALDNAKRNLARLEEETAQPA